MAVKVRGSTQMAREEKQPVHKEQVVGIAVRLFAVFLVVSTVGQAAALIPYVAESGSTPAGLLFVILVMLILLAMAAPLWHFPLTVAGKLIPRAPAADLPWISSPNDIAAVALPIMGIWVLAGALPELFRWAVYAYLFTHTDLQSAPLSPEAVGHMVASTIALAIGAFLLFGSSGLVKLLQWVRYAGSNAGGRSD